MSTKTKNKHIFYFDALRAAAILCVVLIHVTGFMPKIMPFDSPAMFYSFSGVWELFANNSFRIGVDLFLMLSGALSLGRDWEIKDFLGKRLPRIIKPFVFWAIVCSLILIVATFFIPKIGFIKDFSLLSILKVIYNSFLFQSPSFSAYWFFWMILGTYFIMPIFNRWLHHSDLKEAEYFLVLWVINTIFDYTLMVDCPVRLSYFTSPIGFVVLGYYLRHTQRKIFNNKYIALLMIIVPMLVMLVYSFYVLNTEVLFTFNRYSILLLIEVTGVFCLFKCSERFKNPNVHFKKLVTAIATCSYGMYLTHCMLIHLIGKFLPLYVQGYFASYVILLSGALFGSLILIYTLGKVPIVNDWIGIK